MHLKRKGSLILTTVLMLGMVACNTWPTIIATAQAVSSITTIFYPQVGAWASLAVNLLQQAEAAAQAYQANKNASTEAAYIAAIQSVETKLPQDLQSLNVPAADQQKVVAVSNIILDFVEAEAAQLPVTQPVVTNARMTRKAGPVPKRMSKAAIKARWSQVCGADTKCLSLVK